MFVKNAYDDCTKPSFKSDLPLENQVSKLLELQKDVVDFCEGGKNCYELGTGWTAAWAFNASLMIIQGCNFILISIGGFWFWTRLVGTYLNVCFGCIHIAAISTAFSATLNPFGQICLLNITHNK